MTQRELEDAIKFLSNAISVPVTFDKTEEGWEVKILLQPVDDKIFGVLQVDETEEVSSFLHKALQRVQLGNQYVRELVCGQDTINLIKSRAKLVAVSKNFYGKLKVSSILQEFFDIFLEVVLDFDDALLHVSKEWFKQFNFSTEEIFNIAVRNTLEQNPINIDSLNNKIMQLIDSDTILDTDSESCTELYVLTDKSTRLGATCLYTKDGLRGLAAQLGANLFLLPSSCNEILALADDGVVESCDLQQMVYDVNCTAVSEKDFLSNSVYYYDRNEDVVRCLGGINDNSWFNHSVRRS